MKMVTSLTIYSPGLYVLVLMASATYNLSYGSIFSKISTFAKKFSYLSLFF